MVKAITIKVKTSDEIITAKDVAEAFIDCVKEGRMESNAALWYLDLIYDLFTTEHEIAAVIVLSCVLHHANSPICSELEGLFKKFVERERCLVSFMDDFLGHDDIDDYLLELSSMETRLVNAMSREKVLTNLLKEVKDDYDYILIDCMPSLGMITINVLTAADSVRPTGNSARLIALKAMQLAYSDAPDEAKYHVRKRDHFYR